MSITSAPDASQFIHVPSISRIVACLQEMDEMDVKLSQLYDDEVILGYNLVVICNESLENEESISTALAWAVTKRVYPYLFARVQLPSLSSFHVNQMMRDFHYERVR